MSYLLSSEFATLLVGALLHTLWQGAVIAGLLWIALRAMPAKRASARYLACVFAMLAVLVALAVTWRLSEEASVPASGVATWHVSSSMPARATPPAFASIHEIARAKPPAQKIDWMRWAAWIWSAGVVVMLVRALLALHGAGRLRRRCVAITEPSVLVLLDVVRTSMRVARHVKLCACDQITSPAVIGIIWPTILLPLSIASGTDVQTLRMILAHELAHVRRYDYLLNLFQLLIEALLFFNPAVWWISRQLRIEREACCDARAIACGAAPSEYARALASFGEICARSRAMMAMSGQQPGGLLDRVRRALAPSHRPGVRLPWYSLTGALIVSALVLASVWRTSTLAVAFAQDLLTPQQRIEKTNETRKEFGSDGVYLGKVQITGTVKTADGKKVPRGLYGQLTIVSSNSTMNAGIPINPNGSFKYDYDHGGTITMRLTAPGYAPAFAGPVAPTADGKLDPIQLVLERGFIGTFHVVDDAGQPVNNARISGGFTKGEISCSSLDLHTDAQGTATTDSAATLPLYLSIEADGYEPASFSNLTIDRTAPLELTLKRAKPSSGVVTDKSTGKPIAGAKIRIAAVVGPKSMTNLDESNPAVATTDANGEFTLNSLRRDSIYTLWVTARGFGHELVPNVTAGRNDIEIKLGQGIHFKGKIVGPLNTLYKEDNGTPYVIYSIMRELNHDGWGRSAHAPVTVKNGDATFEIDDIWPGNFSIQAGTRNFPFQVDQSRDDVVLELTTPEPKPAEHPKRKIVFTFSTPEGAPPPTGTMQVTATVPLPNGNGLIPIKDGKAEALLDVPCQMGYKPNGTIGYWFKEEYGKMIDAGDDLEIPLDAIPAGAIFGKVTGTPAGADLADNCLLSVATDRAVQPGAVVNDSEHVKSDGRFYIGTVPLGGSYRIIAHLEKQFAVSDPIDLDDSQPLREIELKFADGTPVDVNVVNDQGQPLGAIPVDFVANIGNMAFGFSPVLATDSSGHIRFDHVVPDVASYHLDIAPKRDYQPQRVVIDFAKLPVQVKLEKGLVLEGVVKDEATGNPLRGAAVKAQSKDVTIPWVEAESPTNDKGEFRFSNLTSGDWNLLVDYSGISEIKPMHVIVSDTNEPVEMAVKLRKE